jgi:hypothetical protein
MNGLEILGKFLLGFGCPACPVWRGFAFGWQTGLDLETLARRHSHKARQFHLHRTDNDKPLAQSGVDAFALAVEHDATLREMKCGWKNLTTTCRRN